MCLVAQGTNSLLVGRWGADAVPFPALASDLTACSISRPSASKLLVINMVERNIKSRQAGAQ